ncbi:c-type cytochrome biogenesis protein CcmI [Reinekea thalattae]|uniref:C-type cytochrome biogenesis protein CcmI n=1 Tax=Reinekea thalattae TaxID=2593301 RepID=A0A5C8Z6J7_9GAMM|nr:c-type cytochrome biogenesis protein CcmI [Reinekea thalattae]TXR53725.1 c-type cytochrome biogenesis protein CcmI [Reinekea thalattae]
MLYLWMLLLLLPALLFLLFAVRLRKQLISAQDSTIRAIDIHREQLAQLEQQYQQGQLNEADYHALKQEQQRALLADSALSVAPQNNKAVQQSRRLGYGWWLGLSLLVCSAAFVAYQQLGSASAVKVQQQFAELANADEFDAEAVYRAISDYQALLQTQPENLEGWFQLANLQKDLQLYQPALASFQHLLNQIRRVEHNVLDEASLLSSIGEMHFFLAQRPEALAAFEQSLQLAQTNTALGLAGRVSYELGQYEQSIDYWLQLKNANPEADMSLIDGFIETSIAALAAQGIDYQLSEQTRLQLKLLLPEAWQGLTPQAALFVYARVPGERQPIAVKRLAVTAQQMSILLSDNDSMTGAQMGDFSELEVLARISLSGSASPSAGDWQAEPVLVAPQNQPAVLQLTIRQP